MKLRAGDLVVINEMVLPRAHLYAEPASTLFVAQTDGSYREVAYLDVGEPAIVISLSSYDGRCIYVIGPHGSGWTFGAYLKKVK